MDKEQKKIRETLIEIKRISLRFRRKEMFILSLDLHDSERHRRWCEHLKEKNRSYSKLFRVLYENGIDALKLKVFY